jgi:hypothetical protein
MTAVTRWRVINIKDERRKNKRYWRNNNVEKVKIK